MTHIGAKRNEEKSTLKPAGNDPYVVLDERPALAKLHDCTRPTTSLRRVT